jgi:hypothetical protein
MPHIGPEGLAVLVIAQVHSIIDRAKVHGMGNHSLIIGATILLWVHRFHEEHTILHPPLGEVKQLRNTHLEEFAPFSSQFTPLLRMHDGKDLGA